MGGDPRAYELRRRRHRRRKIAQLMARLRSARTPDEKARIVEKMLKLAPWRHAEFRRLLG